MELFEFNKKFTAGDVVNNVLIGKNNILYLFGGNHKPFSYSSGEIVPDQQSATNFFHNFTRRSRYLDARNIKYFHLIFPSKELVVSSSLPDIYCSNRKPKSLFQSFYATQYPQLLDSIIYPLDLISHGENIDKSFKDHDTHMTSDAYSLIVQLLLQKLDLAYDPIHFFSRELQNSYSDLAKMIGVNFNSREIYLNPYTYLYSWDNRASLPGNTNNIKIYHNPDSLTSKRLLIFGDSFIKDALQYFAIVFRDVIYFRSEFMHEDIVELVEPHCVITSNAERYLSHVNSDLDRPSLLFSKYGKNYLPSQQFIDAYKAEMTFKYQSSYYQRWSTRYRNLITDANGIGTYKSMNQIVILQESGEFYLTGNDPSLVFNIRVYDSIFSDLVLELYSEVNSCSSLYYRIDENDYCEMNSRKMPVKIGYNRIVFTLPECIFSSELRLDPLSSVGSFRIKRLFFNSERS